MPEDMSSPTGWSAARGQALRQRRIALGLRQQDLADQVRQPRTVVSNWENGSRSPSAASRELLSVALRMSMRDLDRVPDEVSDPRTVGPDRWRGLWPVVNGYLGPSGYSRLERFTRQVDTFQRLAAAEFAQARWQQLHAATASRRSELQETIDVVGAKAKGPWEDNGAELAALVRTFLQLGTAPLPSLTVTAELCGFRVFLVALPEGTSGQLQGIACPIDGIGVAALINSDLDPDIRLGTLARLLGSTLLSQTVNAVIVTAATASGTTRRTSARHATLTAFAEEFVLPQAALASCASTVRRMVALTPQVSTDLFEQNALADLISTYRARRSTTFPRYLSALGRARSTWPQGRSAYPSEAEVDAADRARRRADGQVQEAVISAPARRVTYRPRLADLPQGFVDLLLAEVAANRFSVAAVAELTGIDEREIEGRVAPHPADQLHDVREREFSVA